MNKIIISCKFSEKLYEPRFIPNVLISSISYFLLKRKKISYFFFKKLLYIKKNWSKNNYTRLLFKRKITIQDYYYYGQSIIQALI